MSAFRDKLLSIGVVSKRTGPKVVEGRDDEGCRTKTTIDELGNHVTEHANTKDQVDVKIHAPHIRLATQEIRNG